MISEADVEKTEEIAESVQVAKHERDELIRIAKVRRLSEAEKVMMKLAEDTIDRGERILKMRNWRFNL